MIGRRAAVSLSLMCALLFCAIAAQGASAAWAPAKNTTAYTCESGATQDFSDAHCDTQVTAGTGAFGHKVIPTSTSTAIVVSNEKTESMTTKAAPAILKGEAFLTKLEIECKTVKGSGTIENVEEPALSKNHQVKGEATTEFGVAGSSPKDCTVKKPLKCQVKNEPIKVESVFEGVEEAGGSEMGVEFKPKGGGKVFATIEFENEPGQTCSLNTKKIEVEGSAIATGNTPPGPKAKWSGATSVFTNEMTKEKLKFGGVAAEFSATLTTKMNSGNPISLTTPT
jgi:hypothetical protein